MHDRKERTERARDKADIVRRSPRLGAVFRSGNTPLD